MEMQLKIDNLTPIVEKQDRPLKAGSIVSFKSRQSKCHNCVIRHSCLCKTTDNMEINKINTVSRHPSPVHKGEFVYYQDDSCTSLYMVRSGAVKSYRVDKNGQEHVIDFYLPGEMFGTDGLANGRHQNFAQALDTTAICEINYKELNEMFKTSRKWQQRLIQMLSAEYLGRTLPLLCLHHRPVEERLATFIANISSRFSARNLSSSEFILPMSRRDIAHHLGTTEETISRLFSRFRNMGMLTVKGRMININDRDKLMAMSLRL